MKTRSIGRWAAGIAAAVIGSLSVFLLTRDGGLLNPDPDCVIRGSVFAAAEPHAAIANATVTYVSGDEPASELARTNPEGAFEGACPAAGSFPIEFLVDHQNWTALIPTNTTMSSDGTETVLNFYIDDEFGGLPLAQRSALLASVAGYTPVYLLTPDIDELAGRITIPETSLVTSVEAISERFILRAGPRTRP